MRQWHDDIDENTKYSIARAVIARHYSPGYLMLTGDLVGYLLRSSSQDVRTDLMVSLYEVHPHRGGKL